MKPSLYADWGIADEMAPPSETSDSFFLCLPRILQNEGTEGATLHFRESPLTKSLLRARNVVARNGKRVSIYLIYVYIYIYLRERERKREERREERNVKYVRNPCVNYCRDYSLRTLHVKRHGATCAILNHVQLDCRDRGFYSRIIPISKLQTLRVASIGPAFVAGM